MTGKWQWWQRDLTMLSQVLFRETKKGRKVTGVQWNEESLCVIVRLHWRLGHASLKLIRSDSYKRVTMLRWIEFVSSTVLSIAYLSVQWTILQINGVQTIGAVCKGIFPTVLSDMKMDTHWHIGKETDRRTLRPNFWERQDWGHSYAPLQDHCLL